MLPFYNFEHPPYPALLLSSDGRPHPIHLTTIPPPPILPPIALRLISRSNTGRAGIGGSDDGGTDSLTGR